MSRILSQHSNVIAAEFRRRVNLTVEVTFDTLYQDDRVRLYCSRFSYGGQPVPTLPPDYFLADLRTGKVQTL